MNATRKDALEIFRAPVQLKLSAPWISVMFCYIYGDYFGLYVPGTLKSLLEGHATQSMLLAFTAMMVIPCLMPFLAVTLKAPVNRAVNIFFGVAYSIIILVTMRHAWLFYQALGVVEIALTLLVVWFAWKWPRTSAHAQIPERKATARSSSSPLT